MIGLTSNLPLNILDNNHDQDPFGNFTPVSQVSLIPVIPPTNIGNVNSINSMGMAMNGTTALNPISSGGHPFDSGNLCANSNQAVLTSVKSGGRKYDSGNPLSNNQGILTPITSDYKYDSGNPLNSMQPKYESGNPLNPSQTKYESGNPLNNQTKYESGNPLNKKDDIITFETLMELIEREKREGEGKASGETDSVSDLAEEPAIEDREAERVPKKVKVKRKKPSRDGSIPVASPSSEEDDLGMLGELDSSGKQKVRKAKKKSKEGKDKTKRKSKLVNKHTIEPSGNNPEGVLSILDEKSALDSSETALNAPSNFSPLNSPSVPSVHGHGSFIKHKQQFMNLEILLHDAFAEETGNNMSKKI